MKVKNEIMNFNLMYDLNVFAFKKDKNGTGCSICLDEIHEVIRIFLFAIFFFYKLIIIIFLKFKLKQKGIVIISTICGHIICKVCSDQLFLNKDQIECPTCRKELKKHQVHTLFI
jgi:hypothetical protein